jgi:hypothetical protein
LPPRPDDEYEAQLYDKYIAPLANATAAQLAAVNENIAATTRAQQQADQERAAAIIETSATQWRAQYPMLSDGEYDALTDRIARSGTFPAMIAAHRQDIAAATRATLEQNFWADEQLRRATSPRRMAESSECDRVDSHVTLDLAMTPTRRRQGNEHS